VRRLPPFEYLREVIAAAITASVYPDVLPLDKLEAAHSGARSWDPFVLMSTSVHRRQPTLAGRADTAQDISVYMAAPTYSGTADIAKSIRDALEQSAGRARIVEGPTDGHHEALDLPVKQIVVRVDR